MKPRFLYCALIAILLFAVYSCGGKTDSSTATEATTDTPTPKAEDATKKNMDLAKSFYSYYDQGDWAAIEKLLASEITDHGPMIPTGTAKLSRDSLIKILKANKEAFPDGKFEVLSAAAEGDYVFVQYRFAGTNTGSMMGMPPTNKKVDYTGVDLVRVRDGVAAEHWDYSDMGTFMAQIGSPWNLPVEKKK